MNAPTSHHVVLTTHNSRTSVRMRDHSIIKGSPINLHHSEEIQLTKIIGQIVLENELKILSYNICKDHIHLLLVCDESKVTSQIQKLKSISSKLFHRHVNITSHLPEEHGNHLWSQKFYYGLLDEFSIATISRTPSVIYEATHCERTISYIKNNRIKHGLVRSEKLEAIIDSFTVSMKTAYGLVDE